MARLDTDQQKLLAKIYSLALNVAVFDTLHDVLQIYIQSHFKRCIEQLFTPEQVGDMVPTDKELSSIVKNLVGERTRQASLGKVVGGIGITVKEEAFSVSGSASNESHLQTLLSALQLEVKVKPDFDNLSYDPAPVLEFINKEKADGHLVDDPAWDWDVTMNAKRQWINDVTTSMETLKTAYVRACKSNSWQQEIDIAGDISIISLLTVKEIVNIFLNIAPKALLSKPKAGPMLLDNEGNEQKQDETAITLEHNIKMGIKARDMLRKRIREEANLCFFEKKYEHAEKLYQTDIDASVGEEDPSLILNRAAALLKLERFSETEEICSKALTMLESQQDDKSRNLAWKGHMRRGSARKGLAGKQDPTEMLELARSDFEAALRLDPKDETARQELESIKSPTAAKPREKTILESPFFRSDLVNGLMRDIIASPDFPLSSLLLLLQIPAEADRDSSISNSQDQATRALTAKNHSHLTDAIQALGASLALPENQTAPTEASALKLWLLKSTSLRVILGSCAMLSNNLVKAQSEFELVSDALRPTKKPTPKGKERIETMLAQVQGVNFWMLQKCCALQGNKQEAEKFERWLKAWQNKHTEGMDWFQWVLK